MRPNRNPGPIQASSTLKNLILFRPHSVLRSCPNSLTYPAAAARPLLYVSQSNTPSSPRAISRHQIDSSLPRFSRFRQGYPITSHGSDHEDVRMPTESVAILYVLVVLLCGLHEARRRCSERKVPSPGSSTGLGFATRPGQYHQRAIPTVWVSSEDGALFAAACSLPPRVVRARVYQFPEPEGIELPTAHRARVVTELRGGAERVV